MAAKTIAIILASGGGERSGHYLPKQFIKIAGKTIIEHAIEVFEKHARIDEIYVIILPGYRALFEEILLKNRYRKIDKILNGGATRRESSSIGVHAVPYDDAKLIIHDAVRPFVSNRIIDECIDALDHHQAVDVAIPAADTIIRVDDHSFIESIPERKHMMRGQTPQAFTLRTIRGAHRLALEDSGLNFTDDCGIVLHHRLAPVYVVKGEERNIKITYPEDIFLADKLFQLRAVDMCGAQTSYEDLRDKVMVIFGASKGIGKCVADFARSYGAKVHGFSRSNGVDIVDNDKVVSSLKKVFEAEHKINYVVNTAAILEIGKLEERDYGRIVNEVNINYLGAVNVVRASIPYLRLSRGSMLLYTSSSYTRGRGLYSIYSSTKAAIVNFVQACSEEVFEDGIRINTINPERTATPMRFASFGKEPPESLLSPERVAEISVKTLLSDLSGQVIYVTRDTSSF